MLGLYREIRRGCYVGSGIGGGGLCLVALGSFGRGEESVLGGEERRCLDFGGSGRDVYGKA